MLCKHEVNPQENNNTEAGSEQSRFATLLKSHPCTDTPPIIPAHQAISGKIVGFSKFIGKIQQLARKRSQKNN